MSNALLVYFFKPEFHCVFYIYVNQIKIYSEPHQQMSTHQMKKRKKNSSSGCNVWEMPLASMSLKGAGFMVWCPSSSLINWKKERCQKDTYCGECMLYMEVRQVTLCNWLSICYMWFVSFHGGALWAFLKTKVAEYLTKDGESFTLCGSVEAKTLQQVYIFLLVIHFWVNNQVGCYDKVAGPNKLAMDLYTVESET